MTARLAPHADVAGRMPEVVERLVAAGLDVEVLNEEPNGDPDPLGGVRDGSLDLALVGARALRESAADDLTTVAVLPRGEYRDVLVTLRGAPKPLSRMKRGSRVALRGARRSAFLRAHRPDAEVLELDGAVERAREGFPGRADALVTGRLEARRLGLHDRVAEALDPRAWPPEPGQGALALIARHPIAEATALDHLPTRTALRTELALLDALGVDPEAPVGSLALTSGRWIRLWAAAASRDGGRLVRSDLTGPLDEPEALGTAVARQLADRGIALVLAGAA
jgi:hydroxymethylbilane synthase